MKIKILLLSVFTFLLSGCETYYKTSFKAKVVNESVEYLTPNKEKILKSEIEKILMYEVLGAYRDAVFFSQWKQGVGMNEEFYKHLYLCKERINVGGPSNPSLGEVGREEMIRMIKSGNSVKASESFYSRIRKFNVDFGNSKFSRKGSVYVHDVIVKWWCDFDGTIVYIYGTSPSYPPTIETVKKGVKIKNVLEKEIDSDYSKYCSPIKYDSVSVSGSSIIYRKWKWASPKYNKLKKK